MSGAKRDRGLPGHPPPRPRCRLPADRAGIGPKVPVRRWTAPSTLAGRGAASAKWLSWRRQRDADARDASRNPALGPPGPGRGRPTGRGRLRHPRANRRADPRPAGARPAARRRRRRRRVPRPHPRASRALGARDGAQGGRSPRSRRPTRPPPGRSEPLLRDRLGLPERPRPPDRRAAAGDQRRSPRRPGPGRRPPEHRLRHVDVPPGGRRPDPRRPVPGGGAAGPHPQADRAGDVRPGGHARRARDGRDRGRRPRGPRGAAPAGRLHQRHPGPPLQRGLGPQAPRLRRARHPGALDPGHLGGDDRPHHPCRHDRHQHGRDPGRRRDRAAGPRGRPRRRAGLRGRFARPADHGRPVRRTRAEGRRRLPGPPLGPPHVQPRRGGATRRRSTSSRRPKRA